MLTELIFFVAFSFLLSSFFLLCSRLFGVVSVLHLVNHSHILPLWLGPVLSYSLGLSFPSSHLLFPLLFLIIPLLAYPIGDSSPSPPSLHRLISGTSLRLYCSSANLSIPPEIPDPRSLDQAQASPLKRPKQRASSSPPTRTVSHHLLHYLRYAVPWL